ncbi:MAG: hypothetical protein KDK36_18975 [Leptospiraceae bacterium]|nr:hypothetical protein [Leptospiraceae bacterium]
MLRILFGILIIIAVNPIFSFEINRKAYLKNKKRVELFKDKMPEQMQEYYLPRKRYIDRQPLNRSAGPFWQVSIIIEGTELREKYRKNLREIKKLESFLLVADDFQLSRYFNGNEERYLQMKAKNAINEIKELAKLDEQWRKQHDPIFTEYIQTKASGKERAYYKRNKSKFYSEQTGVELVELLQKEAEDFIP